MHRQVLSALVIGLIAMTLGLSPVHAATFIGGPGDAGVGDCIPFGCSDAAVYQQVFDHSLFSSPMTIAGLTFFLRNFDNLDPLTGEKIVPDTILPATYTITFSVVSIPVNGLDTNVENNIDLLTRQTFFIGFLSGSVSDHFAIQTTPQNYFAYNPALGNLLMDIRTDSTDLSLTMYLDINSNSGGTFSSAHDSDSSPFGCPDGCARLDTGLVMAFNTPDEVTGSGSPEPGAFLLGMSGVIAIALKSRLTPRKNRV